MTTRLPELSWGPAGATALRILHSEAPSPATTRELLALEQHLRDSFAEGIVEAVPGFQTLTVCFNPEVCSRVALATCIDTIRVDSLSLPADRGKELELPVYYAPEVGIDLRTVADACGIAPEELIRTHTSTVYHAYANGFAPGFCYLGDIPAQLAMPRLSTPRRQVPAGSVAIADRQTAIYPSASPGGWHLLGRCPTPLFDPQASPPALINVGDRVRFRAIEKAEYLALGGSI